MASKTNAKRPIIRTVRLMSQLAFVIFAVLSCFEPINQDLLIVVADDFAPVLVVNSPLLNDYYISTMTVRGNVVDSSQREGDGKGKLRAIVVSFLEASQYNRTVTFDDSGLPDGEYSFFTYDPETGDFSLDFDTVGLEGDI